MCLTGCTPEKTSSKSKSAATTPAAPVTKSCPLTGPCFEGGTLQHDDAVVQVKTGVSYKQDGLATGVNDGITIKVKCKKNPHVVQFINRQIIKADGTAKNAKMKTTGGEYDLTTDPSKPVWNTDSAAKPNPNYEAAGASTSDSDGLVILDEPATSWGSGPLNLKPGEKSIASFQAYTICDGKVVSQVNWTRSQEHGKAPIYTVAVEKASGLPDWAKKQLKDQGFNSAP